MNAARQALIRVLSRPSRPVLTQTFGMVGDMCKAFYKKDGRDALPIIARVADNSGAQRAEIMRGMRSVKSMKDVAELFQIMDLTIGLGVERIELSDRVFRFKIANCPYGIDGTSRELCEAMMAADKKTINALLGNEVEMKIYQTKAAGDQACEIAFSKG